MADWSLGILFGLLSMVGYGLDNAISQPIIGKIGAAKTAFYRNIFIVLALVVVLGVMAPSISLNVPYLLLALAIGIVGYLPVLSFYEALKLEKVGVVAPISSSSVIYTVLLSLLFFGEKLSAAAAGAILVIMVGVVLVSSDPKDWKETLRRGVGRGVVLALVAGVLWGLVFFLLKLPVNAIGPIISSVLLEVGVLVGSGAHLWMTKSDFKLPGRELWAPILAMAVTGAAGTLFFNLGVEVADVSIVAALSMSSALVATIYGWLVYKEKLSSLQWAAVGLIVAGIVGLQLLG